MFAVLLWLLFYYLLFCCSPYCFLLFCDFAVLFPLQTKEVAVGKARSFGQPGRTEVPHRAAWANQYQPCSRSWWAEGHVNCPYSTSVVYHSYQLCRSLSKVSPTTREPKCLSVILSQSNLSRHTIMGISAIPRGLGVWCSCSEEGNWKVTQWFNQWHTYIHTYKPSDKIISWKNSYLWFRFWCCNNFIIHMGVLRRRERPGLLMLAYLNK